jgi:hypothetical protein
LSKINYADEGLEMWIAMMSGGFGVFAFAVLVITGDVLLLKVLSILYLVSSFVILGMERENIREMKYL